MKNILKHKMIKNLAIIAALWGITPKVNAETQNKHELPLKANVDLFANVEKVGNKDAFADITIAPTVRFGNDEKGITYQGMFYREGDTGGIHTDWLTFIHKIAIENEDFAFQYGRDTTRFETAGYLHANTTTTFANDVRSNGASRSLTGANLTYKPWGVELGYMANNGEYGFKDLDTVVLGYKKQFNKEWGVQLQVGGGHQPISYAGATVAWTPNKDNALVTDIIYKGEQTTGILTARHNITDRLALFAGVEVVKPNHGKTTGLAEAGISYNIGKGFTAVGAFQHEIGGERGNHIVLGLQYAGSFGMGK